MNCANCYKPLTNAEQMQRLPADQPRWCKACHRRVALQGCGVVIAATIAALILGGLTFLIGLAFL